MKQVLLALTTLLALGSAASAQDVAAFYAGKTIRLVVGVDVGSGYDVNARLLARHMGAHIPGNPAFIVQNQPGAGSVTMTSQLYASGPFDGTTIGAAFAGMPTIPLLQPGGSRFDPTKLIWLGNTNRETHVTYVWHTAPVQSLAQARTRELIMGAQAPGSSQVDFPQVADALLGFKFKIVAGYQSTSKINLALESGEVQGTIAAWTTLKTLSSSWLADRKIKVIAQWALRPNPELTDIPNVLDAAKTDDERDALRLVMARLDIGRPFFLPPNVPPDRVAALRAAFDATMKDPDYRAEADQLKVDVDPLTGAELAALVAQVAQTPAETVARVRAALEHR
ncbi:MAG TPA: tripartite tricarboxylate transporter substrate-binding protein [Xanthobacteraceae bacterium]|nr:tripartite tricarboxylate transporter substrate-binding protein [Xanthobacteraceae bacterium]